jgi:sec-independent protein translocase protein TatB
MSNLGGLEILMILVVALIVLGPTKLPDAARQVGKAVTEIRRISSGFQKEFREAIHDPTIEAEARARGAVETAKKSLIEPFTSNPAPTKPDATPTQPDVTPAVPDANPSAPDDTPVETDVGDD